MKFTLALLGAAAAVDADTERAYIEFLAEHGKSYGTREEYEFRLNIFADKMSFIEEHNSRNEGDHVVGMNHMMDWTDSEYKKILGYHAHKKQVNPSVFNHTQVEAPASVDWRTKGAVTPVKNQGQCGSCWSFSATGAMEGAYFLKTGKLESLSEQQLVDCSKSFGNQGCNGGLMDDAFKYAEGTPMEAETDYRYTAKDGTCHATEYKPVEQKLTSFQDVTPNDPEALLAAVSKQPVSIAVDAASLGWQFYHKGVLKRFCGKSLDHGVLLVGYGEEDNGDAYWIVKNSWGPHWGEEGYLRIFREMDKKGPGVCGLQSQPSIPQA